MNWYHRKFSQNKANIQVDISSFVTSVQNYLSHHVGRDNDTIQKHKNNQFDINTLYQDAEIFGEDPIRLQILNLVKTQDIDSLSEIFNIVYPWMKLQSSKLKDNTKKPYDFNEAYDFERKVFHFLRELDDYENYLKVQNGSYDQYDESQMENHINDLTKETYVNMEKIKVLVSSAISRISSWSTPEVVIYASPYDPINEIQAATDATVSFGSSEDYSPQFTFFMTDNKVELDDIQEAGDTEFFTDQKVASDYFSLIKELKSPGSSSQAGKTLKLYTARPVSDRKIYLDSNKIPSNLFLTNNLNSAEGLAVDLAGSDKVRDVWAVAIDSRYLITTLDSPEEKQYQVVGESWVPVKRMQLIIPGQN